MEAPRAPCHRGCERAYIPIELVCMLSIVYALADVFQCHPGQNIQMADRIKQRPNEFP